VERKFSKSEAIRFGWETTKNNLGFFILLLLIAFPISAASSIIQKIFGDKVLSVNILLVVINSILSTVINIGFIKIALKFCDGQKAAIGDLFSAGKLFLPYLVGAILFLLIVFGGLILLIVPGVIWSFKFGFFGYFMVEKGLEPSEALRRSALITQGAKWDLFVFWLLLMLINLAGVAALFIGLFVTLPITIIANAFVYRKLLSRVKI